MILKFTSSLKLVISIIPMQGLIINVLYSSQGDGNKAKVVGTGTYDEMDCSLVSSGIVFNSMHKYSRVGFLSTYTYSLLNTQYTVVVFPYLINKHLH